MRQCLSFVSSRVTACAASSFSIIVFAALVAFAGPASAQDLGRGSLGVNGLRPSLELRSASTGKPFEFVAGDLAQPGPQGGSLWFLVAGAPAEIPLAPLGLPGATLGLDPTALLLVGPVPIDSQGTARFAAPLPAAWSGLSVFVQAMQLDPRVAAGLVLSDSRSMTLGTDEPELVLVADDATPGLVRLSRRLTDGRPGTPVHDLLALRLVDLDLVSIDEARRLRPDLPRPITLEGVRAVRLPDASTVLAYEKPAQGRRGLARIHASGRIERLWEGAAAGLPPGIAASGSHVAFVAGLPPRLWLVRLDGGSWPGEASCALDVTLATSWRLEPDALVVGARVLAYADRNQGMWLFSLADGSARHVAMPQVGGQPPAAFDEEIAVSGDGRVFALGAGPSRKLKDIIVVRDDGVAVNVTRKVSDYAEVGYRNPGRRTDIVLDHTGARVSYVDEGGQEPEGYVTTVATPSPVHITTSVAFVDSIDIGSTSRMPRSGGGLVFAGLNDNSLDLFFTAGLTDKDILPMTRTGTATQMPFARDAQLTLRDLASIDGATPFVLEAQHVTRGPLLYVVDTVRKTTREALQGQPQGIVPLDRTGRLLLGDAQGLVLLDTTDPGPSFVQRVPGPSGNVLQLGYDAAAGRAVARLRTSAADEIWTLAVGASVTAQRIGQASSFGDLSAGHVPGALFALSPPRTSGGRELLSWDAQQGFVPLGGQGLRAFVQK